MPSKEFDSGEIDRIALEVKRRLLSGELDADLQSLATDKHSINNSSALLVKTSDQSISADTNTVVDWETRTLDGIYSYDTSTDKITLGEPGDYRINCGLEIRGINDQDKCELRVNVNGSPPRKPTNYASGTVVHLDGNVLLKDLNAGTTLSLGVRIPTSSTLKGFSQTSYAQITREA